MNDPLSIKPGAGNLEDPITHSGEEFVHCLDGEIEFCIEDRVFRLEPGDSLLFEAAQPHAYHNPNQRLATILLVMQTSQGSHLPRQLHLEV